MDDIDRTISSSTNGFVLPFVLAILSILGVISGSFFTWVALELKVIKRDRQTLQERIWVDYVKNFQFEMYEKFQTLDEPFVLQEGEDHDAIYQIFDSYESLVAVLGQWRFVNKNEILTADWRLKLFSEFEKNEMLFAPLRTRSHAFDLSKLNAINNNFSSKYLWVDCDGSTGPLWQVACDFFQNRAQKLRPYELVAPAYPISLSLKDWMLSPSSDNTHHFEDQRVDPVCSACAPLIEQFTWAAEIEVQEHLTEHGIFFDYYFILKPTIVFGNPHAFLLEEARYHLSWITLGNSVFAESQLQDVDFWSTQNQYSLSTYSKQHLQGFSDFFKFIPGEKKIWHLPIIKWPLGLRVQSGHRLKIQDLNHPPCLQDLRLEMEYSGQRFTIQFSKKVNFTAENYFSIEWVAGNEMPVFQNPIYFAKWLFPEELLKASTKDPITPSCLKHVRWNPLAPIALGYIGGLSRLSQEEREWLFHLNQALWDDAYSSASPNVFVKNKKLVVKRPFWISTQDPKEWKSFLEDLDLGLSAAEIADWSVIWAHQVKSILDQGDLRHVSQLLYSKGLPDFNPIWGHMPYGLTFERFWEKAWLRLQNCPHYFELILSKSKNGTKKRLEKWNLRPVF